MIAYTAVERLLIGGGIPLHIGGNGWMWCPTCDRVDAGVLYTADQR